MATTKQEKQGVDPRIHLKSLEQVEKELLKGIKDKEKQMRLLIEELKALRELIKATSRQVEKRSTQEKEQEKESQEAVDILEEVVAQSSKETSDGQKDFMPNYSNISAQKITKAASLDTLYELSQLQNKDYLTKDEQYSFFSIQNAVEQTMNYSSDINPVVMQTVGQAYNAIKELKTQHQDQLKETYNPTQFEEQFKPRQQYTTESFKPTEMPNNIKEYTSTTQQPPSQPPLAKKPAKEEGPKKNLAERL